MNVFVKLIVTVKLKGLSLGRFLTKTKAMVKAQEDNPTMVPGLDPDAPTVKLKIKAIDDKNTERKVLVQKVKDLTGEIKDLITEVTNIMTSDWAPAIQKAADGDANFVKTLCFSSKGEDKTPPVVTINNSIPTIINLTTNQSLKQEMEVINSNTKGSRLPAGAKFSRYNRTYRYF